MSDRRTAERLAWLQRNRRCWEGYKLNWRTVDLTFDMMQVAGLYSFTTHCYDCRSSLAKLMRAARGQGLGRGPD